MKKCLLLASAGLLGCTAVPMVPAPAADADLAMTPAPPLPAASLERLYRGQTIGLEPMDAPGEVPSRLSRTGLYTSIQDRQLSAGIQTFKPQYELWSDGAEKTRYVLLPPGEKIDTSNMNRWIFPVGTKLWKEFRRAGKLIETRLIWKRKDLAGQIVWSMVPYVWNEAEQDAVSLEPGLDNARGTGHRVPSQAECKNCHPDQAERPIGFSAIQLSGAGTGLRLRDLVDRGLLTSAPANPDGFTLPGDDKARAALGYLHGNCGGCHATDIDLSAGVDMALRQEVGKLANPLTTPAYLTTANILTTSLKAGMKGQMVRLKPGSPTASAMYFRMGVRLRHPESLQMPPYGTDVVDDSGRAIIERWIASLTP